jgi:hypothetical protein
MPNFRVQQLAARARKERTGCKEERGFGYKELPIPFINLKSLGHSQVLCAAGDMKVWN